MAADKHGQVVASDVEDKLAFVAFVLVDGHLAHIEMLEDVLQRGDCGIGDAVKILIGDTVLFGLGVESLFCGLYWI